MPDSENDEVPSDMLEENAVVPGSQPKVAREVTMERRNVARARAGVAEDSLEDLHRDGAIKPAYIGLCAGQPFDAIGRVHFFSGKSSGLTPYSANTSSMGMPLPSLSRSQRSPSSIRRRSASVTGSSSSMSAIRR